MRRRRNRLALPRQRLAQRPPGISALDAAPSGAVLRLAERCSTFVGGAVDTHALSKPSDGAGGPKSTGNSEGVLRPAVRWRSSRPRARRRARCRKTLLDARRGRDLSRTSAGALAAAESRTGGRPAPAAPSTTNTARARAAAGPTAAPGTPGRARPTRSARRRRAAAAGGAAATKGAAAQAAAPAADRRAAAGQGAGRGAGGSRHHQRADAAQPPRDGGAGRQATLALPDDPAQPGGGPGAGDDGKPERPRPAGGRPE